MNKCRECRFWHENFKARKPAPLFEGDWRKSTCKHKTSPKFDPDPGDICDKWKQSRRFLAYQNKTERNRARRYRNDR